MGSKVNPPRGELHIGYNCGNAEDNGQGGGGRGSRSPRSETGEMENLLERRTTRN